jgi:CheY-like chemotaxis protein
MNLHAENLPVIPIRGRSDMRKKTTGLFDESFNYDNREEPTRLRSGSSSGHSSGSYDCEEATRPTLNVVPIDDGDIDNGEEPTRPSPGQRLYQARAQATRQKILVVEDEGIVALDLSTTLQQMGYMVTGAAASGEEAIQLAIESKPDLVLMDVRLHGQMDGIDASKEIQARLGVPVIFLTAFVDEKTIQRALEVQHAGFLRKPYSKSELLEAIEAAVKPLAFD